MPFWREGAVQGTPAFFSRFSSRCCTSVWPSRLNSFSHLSMCQVFPVRSEVMRCIQEMQVVLLSRPVICMAPVGVLVFGLSAVCPWYSLGHHRNGATCRVQCCVRYYHPRILQSLAHLHYTGGEAYSMWILGTSQASLLCWCSFVWSTAATHPVEWR